MTEILTYSAPSTTPPTRKMALIACIAGALSGPLPIATLIVVLDRRPDNNPGYPLFLFLLPCVAAFIFSAIALLRAGIKRAPWGLALLGMLFSLFWFFPTLFILALCFGPNC